MHRNYRTHHPNGPMPRWGPVPGWGQPLPGWSPLIDDGPLPLRAASTVARWWWPILALAAFGTVAGFVLGHDDPTPGLSARGMATIALAALVVVLLTIHRAAGPRPLTRALAEYSVVALVTLLLATTGLDVDQPPTDGTQASIAPDHRPALVKTLDGFRDWLGEWREWVHKETDRRGGAASTTPDQCRALPRSPAASSSTRRWL